MTVANFGIQKGDGSAYVKDLMYHPHIGESGLATMHVEGAAAPNTILTDAPIAVTPNSTHEVDLEIDAPFGRIVRVQLTNTAPGSTVAGSIVGFDYLGQPMLQSFAAATLTTTKAFKRVTEIRAGSALTSNVSILLGNAFGLPFCGLIRFHSISDGDLDTSAGTFTEPAIATPTASTGDPRGTFVPITTPNGARDFKVIYLTTNDLPGGLYGQPQYAG